MAECIECGKYTKYNGGLCTDCYPKKKSPETVDPKNTKSSNDNYANEKQAGLTDKERSSDME